MSFGDMYSQLCFHRRDAYGQSCYPSFFATKFGCVLVCTEMAPDPGAADKGERTVACDVESVVPDEAREAAIRDAVHRTHKGHLTHACAFPNAWSELAGVTVITDAEKSYR